MCARSNSCKSLWPLGHRIHIVASFQVTSFLLKTAVWIFGNYLVKMIPGSMKMHDEPVKTWCKCRV